VNEIPHLERYVINVFRPRFDTRPTAIGGVAEQWFASAEAMRTAFLTPAAERARADIADCSEAPRNISGVVDENLVV
jgi:hypothetical protein